MLHQVAQQRTTNESDATKTVESGERRMMYSCTHVDITVKQRMVQTMLRAMDSATPGGDAIVAEAHRLQARCAEAREAAI